MFDVLVILVGNVGNIIVYWKGFKEYYEKNGIGFLKMCGFEVEGVVVIVCNEVIENLEIIVIVICIGNLVSWDKVVKVVEEFNGKIDEVIDDEIFYVY